MTKPLSKTEAGQHEIRARRAALARPARTLLVLADGTRNGAQLLAMVQGASPADLQALLDAGLLADGAPAVEMPPTAALDAGAAPAVAAEAGGGLGYQELYDSLNALVKEQLGLFKGFRYALEIEKAGGVAGLQDLAQRFAAEVQRVNGDSAAQMVRRALGLPR